jgi:hypothetical protein
MNSKSVVCVLALGLFAGLVACEDHGVVAPGGDALAPHDLGIAAKKPVIPDDDFVWTDLEGGYTTEDPQRTSLSEARKTVSFIAKGGKEINYSLDPGFLDWEYYSEADCRAGGSFSSVISTDEGKEAFWNVFLAAQFGHPHRLLTSVVLPGESGLPSEGHRSEGYWFTEHIDVSELDFPLSEIDDAPGELNKLMWLYKIGTISSLFDPDTGPRAVATWDPVDKVAVFSGGVVWLKVRNCGRPGSRTCKLGGMSVGCDNTSAGRWFKTAVNHEW